MLPDKVIKAEKVTASRTPDGGGMLNLATKGGPIEVLLTADAWLKLEDSVRWFNPQIEKQMNGHANGAAKTNGTTEFFDFTGYEVRLVSMESRMKDIEKRLARMKAP